MQNHVQITYCQYSQACKNYGSNCK